MSVDTLIKDGLIVDGSGGEPYRGDVAVKDGRIAGVGRITESAGQVIDAGGLAISPGFWDIHTHYDVQLLWDPMATSSCWHGVTTIVMGNCGFSVAPCRPEDQEWMVKLLFRLEGITEEALLTTLPWPWEDFGAYLDHLDGAIGVNAVPQVGHMPVRRYVMGREASERGATASEIERMRGLVAESIRAGAMGFSTSRAGNHWDGEGRPVPSRLASEEEYLTLAGEMAGLKAGFVQLLAPEFDWDKQAGIARRVGRPLCLNAIIHQMHLPDAWREELDRMERMRAEGTPFFAQGHCQAHDFEVTFEATDVFDRWPSWKDVLSGSKERRMALMSDQAVRDRLKEEMDGAPLSIVPLSWDQIILVRSASGRYRELEMQTIADIALRQGRHALDTAFDIAVDEELRTHFRVLDPRNRDEDAMLAILKSPHVVPGPSDAGAHILRGVNTAFPTRLLGYWVREKQAMSLQEAVYRLSGLAADEVGVTDRGRLLEGQAGDIVVFDPEKVAPAERLFLDDLPGGATRLVQYAEGIVCTMVNGKVTQRDGQPTGDLGGRTLRSGDYRGTGV